MKHIKKSLFCSILALGLSIGTAQAGVYEVSSYDLKVHPQKFNLTPDQQKQVDLFMTYEMREPCQHYQDLPQGFIYRNCDVFLQIDEKQVVAVAEPVVTTRTVTQTITPPPKTLAAYEVFFDFDKSNLDSADKAVLSQIANEIQNYNPSEVTVEGHTDTSGAQDYNYELSQKRALSVSSALTDKGVENRKIDRDAFGETDLAVLTDDGVKNATNRRVVVKFMK